jgi:hypothetical protein
VHEWYSSSEGERDAVAAANVGRMYLLTDELCGDDNDDDDELDVLYQGNSSAMESLWCGGMGESSEGDDDMGRA